tara:strand:- start:1641 stop:1817 length:177 start_codon:yes stop_codon:yes gene_type:complete
MGLLEYAAIAVIVYIALSMILKFTIIAMYLYGMYQFMKDDTDQTQSSVDSDEFNPDYI